jgi:DNA-binding MarR family transcriptional regulator
VPNPTHLALVGALEDLARVQREAGAVLSRTLGSNRGAVAVVRLLERGPQQVGELAQALRVDVSVASRQVAALVDAGLARRDVAADDRRARTVALTDAGRALAGRSAEAALDLASAVFADWSEEDVEAAAAQIGRVADAVSAHHSALRAAQDASHVNQEWQTA